MTNLLAPMETYTIHLAATGAPTIDRSVRFADEAVQAFEIYRDNHGFGASEMKACCGNIYNSAKRLVGRVSYNGRVWDAAGNPVSLA